MKKTLFGLAFVGLLFTGPAYAGDKAGSCKVNVDSATAKDLQQLRGAGDTVAKAIIAHRAAQRAAATKAKKKKWNFKNWKTLLTVKGLGPKFCADNLAHVCFAGKTAPQKACPKAAKAKAAKAVKAAKAAKAAGKKKGK